MHRHYVGVALLTINNSTIIRSRLCSLPYAMHVPTFSILQATSRRGELFAVREKAVPNALLREAYSLVSQNHVDEILSQTTCTSVRPPLSMSSKPKKLSKLTSSHSFVSFLAPRTTHTPRTLRHYSASSCRSARGSQSVHAGTFHGCQSVHAKTFRGIPDPHTFSHMSFLGDYRPFPIRDPPATGLGQAQDGREGHS
jgi:hypothetical protein